MIELTEKHVTHMVVRSHKVSRHIYVLLECSECGEEFRTVELHQTLVIQVARLAAVIDFTPVILYVFIQISEHNFGSDGSVVISIADFEVLKPFLEVATIHQADPLSMAAVKYDACRES
jgi:hypothetical protein